MRKILLLFLIILLSLILALDKLSRTIQKQSSIIKPPLPVLITKEPEFPELIGEKIVYDVKLGEINLGEARFNRLANVQLERRMVNLVIFETRLMRFRDVEKIYSDPETFLPLKVERDIVVWPKAEKINEDYDQKNFILTVTKTQGKKQKQTLLKYDDSIHNAVLLPYYVRRTAKLQPGWILKANLPTQQFEIKLERIEELKTPAGKFKSYYFQSTPRRFEIWISADERRIPLKIKGSVGIGYTMIMREYNVLSTE
jgi:hypothetical protein